MIRPNSLQPIYGIKELGLHTLILLINISSCAIKYTLVRTKSSSFQPKALHLSIGITYDNQRLIISTLIFSNEQRNMSRIHNHHLNGASKRAH